MEPPFPGRPAPPYKLFSRPSAYSGKYTRVTAYYIVWGNTVGDRFWARIGVIFAMIGIMFGYNWDNVWP